jgi:hypothetical protein
MCTRMQMHIFVYIIKDISMLFRDGTEFQTSLANGCLWMCERLLSTDDRFDMCMYFVCKVRKPIRPQTDMQVYPYGTEKHQPRILKHV